MILTRRPELPLGRHHTNHPGAKAPPPADGTAFAPVQETYSMFRLRTAGLLLATALAATAVGTPPAAAGIFFVGSGKEFGTINPVTGAITTLGTASTDTGNPIFGMGFSNGVLYGLDGNDPAAPIAHLFQINTANGATTDLGSTGQTVVGATTNSAGVLFAANFSTPPSTLYQVSPPSLVATTIGVLGFRSAGLLAFDGAGNLFVSGWSTSNGTGPDNLYRVNAATGASTLIGSIGFTQVFAGAFDNGILYGFPGTAQQVIEINTSTGAGTVVSNYSLPNGDIIDAAASASAVPEPGSLVLLGLGLTGLCGLCLRRTWAQAVA